MQRRSHGPRFRQFLLVACAVGTTACELEPGQIAPSGGAGLDPEMLAAMERDLGQSEPQILRRILVEARAARLEPVLRHDLGDTFAGVWMNSDGSQLIVGITDPAQADAVRQAGGEPKLVERSLAELDDLKASIDATGNADAAIHAWRVDLPTNSVVVTAEGDDPGAVAALLGPLAGDARVRVELAGERPRPLYDVRGGDEYILNGNTLCSVGFAVHGGFVTAGHCGGVGSPTAGSNWVAQGTVRGSSFPGADHAWVELNGQWASLAQVKSGGGNVGVAGSNVAPVGSSVCRSGRTTGWRCGVIQAQNVTVNYAQGPVYGTTQTSACAEGGDSGGSFISGDQAQGVTSGGSGNCSSGGTTFFQPLNPILAAYGLSLKTSGGGGDGKAIASNLNGKCIDVPGAKFDDGARLQMWDCNGTNAQRWTFTGGTVRAGGKCMDVAWANPADGTAVQLVSCNGNLAQQFVLTAAGDLVSVLANKCVDIAGWNSGSGAQLIIWPCHGGANQKWRLQ